MFRWLDESAFLVRFVQRLSTLVAKQRGMPVVIGIVFVIASFILQAVNVYAETTLLELLGVVFLHAGVLVALIGLLLAEPLGR